MCPDAWWWPGHVQAAGGHAQASIRARREAHRTPGAISAAMVRMAKNRMAMRMLSAWKPKQLLYQIFAEWKHARAGVVVQFDAEAALRRHLGR